jgi:cobaltochelatase CobS
MSTYTIDTYKDERYETANGREACQFLYDQGCLPKAQRRPLLTDKFNPVMMMMAAIDCTILINGRPLKTSTKPTPASPSIDSLSDSFRSLETKPSTPMTSTSTNPQDLIASAIAQMVASSKPTLDEGRVIELIGRAIDQIEIPKATSLEIKIADKPVVTMARQHHKFEQLLTLVSNGIHTMLYGDSGSSKSTTASKIAEALNRPFHFVGVGATTTKFEFFGYTHANGEVVHTEFRKAFVNGGIFLIDEFDTGSANVGIALNEALANRKAAFPDGIFEAHPNFVCLAAANTSGNGATTEFRGRNAMDKATLERFFILEWNIDEDFEMSLATNKAWCKKVQAIRKAFKDMGIKQPCTPRATLNGEKLLLCGMSEREVMDGLIFKGSLSEDTINQVLNRI